MSKNYYIILGIPPDSTQEDIKAAYRQLAKKFHPDHYGKSQAPFQIIQEAYTILGNPISRKDYDISLQPSARQVAVSTKSTSLYAHRDEDIEPLIPEDEARGERVTAVDWSFPHSGFIFDNVFDKLFGGSTERPGPYRESTEDLTVEITLSPLQARRGGNVCLNLPVQMHCPTCYRYFGFSHNCWRCNGTGFLQGEKSVFIGYPACIEDNHVVKLAISDFSVKPLNLNAIFKIR